MIPAAGNSDFDLDTMPTFEVAKLPGLTYALKPDKSRIMGNTAGIEAVKQAVFKIISTERYNYLIYSWNYGITLHDLFGESISYVKSELAKRITDALLRDDRILEVKDFQFQNDRSVLFTRFTVVSTEGTFEAEKEVAYV